MCSRQCNHPVLIRADGDADLVRGVVDISSGYAMVSTSTGCKAWNYVKVSPVELSLATMWLELISVANQRITHMLYFPSQHSCFILLPVVRSCPGRILHQLRR